MSCNGLTKIFTNRKMLYNSKFIFTILFALFESSQGVNELYCRHWLNLFEQGDSTTPNGCCELDVGEYSPICRANAQLYQNFCPCANNPGGQTVIDDSAFTNRLNVFAALFSLTNDPHDFIWKMMKTIYYGSDYSSKFDHGYWENNKRSIYGLSATEFVSHLTLSPPDRASKWISNGDANFANMISMNYDNSLGIEFEHITYNDDGYLQITRFIPGSLTHQQVQQNILPLKRGYLIKHINGNKVPLTNAHEWFNEQIKNKNSVEFNIYNSTVVFQSTVSVTKSSFTESPVQTHSIIEVGNKKIGYLMYNFFPQTTTEIAEVLTIFKNEGIHELIIDLRLNAGGYISSVLKTGAMLSNHLKDKIAVNIKANSIIDNFYNVEGMEESERSAFFNYTFSSKEKYEVEMGEMISNFHIITSQATAGAAELLIMGMQQYVDVRIIGERTAGDFHLSSIFPFSSTNSSIELVTGIFRPINDLYDNFDQSFNWTRQNECGSLCADSGFYPNLKVMSHETWMTMKDFGDIDEEFLHATITGELQSTQSRRKLNQMNNKNKEKIKKRGISLI